MRAVPSASLTGSIEKAWRTWLGSGLGLGLGLGVGVGLGLGLGIG